MVLGRVRGRKEIKPKQLQRYSIGRDLICILFSKQYKKPVLGDAEAKRGSIRGRMEQGSRNFKYNFKKSSLTFCIYFCIFYMI